MNKMCLTFLLQLVQSSASCTFMTALESLYQPLTDLNAAIFCVVAHSEVLLTLDAARNAKGQDFAMSSINDTMITVYTAFPL